MKLDDLKAELDQFDDFEVFKPRLGRGAEALACIQKFEIISRADQYGNEKEYSRISPYFQQGIQEVYQLIHDLSYATNLCLADDAKTEMHALLQTTFLELVKLVRSTLSLNLEKTRTYLSDDFNNPNLANYFEKLV